MANTTFKVEPGSHAIIMTSTFDAPRELVFRAFTDPKLIAQWWGPRQYKTIVDKMEVRPGGQWRFLHSGEEGEFGFRGVYHDITAPERIVQTFEFEGVPGHAALETARFEELEGGKTRVTTT
ncbi:MAG TPA: SRPBCC domain-containing protein, partial [Chloroflexia bacterium]|nr:SRPBCC domain-containing protein [Chloroflexia bacterium]